MATDDWKRYNPKISGHIPKSLKNQLDQFITAQDLSGVSEALRIILENHFRDSEFLTSSQLLDKSSQPVLNSIVERLKSVEIQIQKHSEIIKDFKISQKNQELSPKVLNSVENSNPKSSELVLNSLSKSSQPVPNRSQLTIFDGWLTTGEAYAELQNRGYEKSQGTFRRTLKEGQVPEELEALGLKADFEVRNTANPKDNSVRWLKVE